MSLSSCHSSGRNHANAITETFDCSMYLFSPLGEPTLSGSSRSSPTRRLVADNQVDLAVQAVEATNQSINREFADPAGDNGRYVGLLEAKHDGGLGQSATFDNRHDFANELGLGKLLFRLGQAKVGKDTV